MLNLKRIFKNYEEAGSLNAMVNLFGFIGPQVFLTKSGEVGVMLEIHGVDYECLDAPAIDGLTKRLESALRLFDENYRIYQLLFKRNRNGAPFRWGCHSGISRTSSQIARRSSDPIFREGSREAQCKTDRARGIRSPPESREFSRTRERLRHGENPRKRGSICRFEANAEF